MFECNISENLLKINCFVMKNYYIESYIGYLCLYFYDSRLWWK